MTWLLNISFFVIAFIGIVFFWLAIKKDEPNWAWGSVAAIFAILILQSLTPSYLPKGEARRSVAPPFLPSEAEVLDRLRKPSQTEEEREARRTESFDAVKQARSIDEEPASPATQQEKN